MPKLFTKIARVIDNRWNSGDTLLGPQMRNYTTVWHVQFSATLGGNPYATFDFFSDDEDDVRSQQYAFQSFWASEGGDGTLGEPIREYIEMDRELVCFAFGCAWRNRAQTSGFLTVAAGIEDWFDITERLTDTSPKKTWSHGE